MADKELVKMDDGSLVEFAGKTRMMKKTSVQSDGSIVTRMDFRNGEFRVHALPAALKDRAACHGIDQKLGDEIAGIEGIEDCVTTMDLLLERLEKGEWNAKREAGGMAGVSILAKALTELSGKAPAETVAYLSTLNQAQKMALRKNRLLVPIIARLESEKGEKGKKSAPAIDSDAILAGFSGEVVASETDVVDESSTDELLVDAPKKSKT